ncbi:MAG: ABC transporter ATP-binding protein, partial [Chloroflexota bacterium]
MAEVRIEHVDKVYPNGVQAVKDLNLHIEDGEFLALLGPSGCGKTSTLRMIVGLEEISSGEIIIRDRVVNNLEPNERNVALAFESYALYPPLTIFDNIAFNLKARGVKKPEIKRRVEEVARVLDITSILKKKPGELGGGQKQRVSLARALVREPDVFLMDEPLSHLDAAQRTHMRVELKRLHAESGRTTILVTHDQLEAVAMAQRIAILNFGVLQQVGTFDEIYNHPVNEFVAGFIGEPPMNVITCEPVSNGDSTALKAMDGGFEVNLPDELRARVMKSNAKQVKLGIRPIHMEAATSSPGNGSVTIEGRVFTFENLGEEGQLAAHVGDNQMLVVTPPVMPL